MFEENDPIKLQGEQRYDSIVELLIYVLAIQKTTMAILTKVVTKPEDPGLNTLTNDELMVLSNAETERYAQLILQEQLARRGTIKNLNSLLGLTPKPLP